jgi:hypothetical protein
VAAIIFRQMGDTMRTINKFLGLGALAIALSCGVADVNAMVRYGKMSNGMGYTEALQQNGNAAAQQKVANAQALAARILQIDRAIFNELPVGMTQEEFVYELLNWPDDVTDRSHNAQISEGTRAKLMAFDPVNGLTDEAKYLWRELKARVTVGKKVLLSAKVSDSRSTKAAVSDVLNAFIQLDTDAATSLGNMQQELLAITARHNRHNAREDQIARLKAKIAVIQRYLPQFQVFRNQAAAIDYDQILDQKRLATHNAALQHHHNNGIGRAAPDNVRLADQQSRITVRTRGSIASKRLMLQALQAYITSIVNDLELLSIYNDNIDEAFADLWMDLADITILYAALGNNLETPRTLFASSGLFYIACLRDINVRKRLYALLVKKYGDKVTTNNPNNPDLEARRYKIPDPVVEDWTTISWLPTQNQE